MARSKTDLKNIPRSRGFRKTGKMIVWKKAYDVYDHVVLVKLEIPAHAQRIRGTHEYARNFFGNAELRGINDEQKCRASEAKVLGMWYRHKKFSMWSRNTPYLGRRCSLAHSSHSNYFEYKVGQTVVPEYNFDTRDVACGSGIHFFTSIKRAANY